MLHVSIQLVKKVPLVYVSILELFQGSWLEVMRYYAQQKQHQRRVAEHPSTSEAKLEAKHQTQHH